MKRESNLCPMKPHETGGKSELLGDTSSWASHASVSLFSRGPDIPPTQTSFPRLFVKQTALEKRIFLCLSRLGLFTVHYNKDNIFFQRKCWVCLLASHYKRLGFPNFMVHLLYHKPPVCSHPSRATRDLEAMRTGLNMKPLLPAGC